MADVFVSYKKEDRPHAERIATKLRAEGFSVWWDADLTPKQPFDALLERELLDAASVVVLWSSRSVTSEWVRSEAHCAGEKLVPVMIERCALPFAFMLRQTIDLSGWHGKRDDRRWQKLRTWIADLVTTKSDSAGVATSLAAVQPNRFREAIGQLASGDIIVDGALVNASTPAGTVFRDCAHGPAMRILPQGAFLLGASPSDPDRAPPECPQRRVEIPAPFALSVFTVSVSEYLAVMGSVPSPVAASDASLPITHVSFDDAQEFIARLSAAAGEAYRLPSEAEWEYACRAGSRSRYCWGDSIDATKAAFAWQATHSPSPPRGPVSAGCFASNVFGLYDMHGNVREWTADLWHESYDATPLDGSPATEGHGAMRVVRGGSWSDGPSLLRCSARMRATHSSRVPTIGLRVARDLILSTASGASSSDEQEIPHPEPDKTRDQTEKPVDPKAWYIDE